VVVKKKDIKDNVLEILKLSRFGLNLKSITEKVECSRTTVTKYLNELEADGFVIDRQIGQYKVWLHRDAYLAGNEMQLPSNSLLYGILSSMLKNMEKLGVEPAFVKQLGITIADDFNFSEYLDKQLLEPMESPPDLKDIADKLMKLIDSVCKIYDNYTWQTPVILPRPDHLEIILRMHNSDFITLAPYNYYLISGFIEHEMNKYVNGTVDVIQIQDKERIVDFQFQFQI
jgi:biotin operon repressor